MIDASIPNISHASGSDAVDLALLPSGHQRCDSPYSDVRGNLPLPAAHYRPGQISLCDPLLTLTSPAWNPDVDGGAHRACFQPRRGYLCRAGGAALSYFSCCTNQLFGKSSQLILCWAHGNRPTWIRNWLGIDQTRVHLFSQALLDFFQGAMASA